MTVDTRFSQHLRIRMERLRRCIEGEVDLAKTVPKLGRGKAWKFAYITKEGRSTRDVLAEYLALEERQVFADQGIDRWCLYLVSRACGDRPPNAWQVRSCNPTDWLNEDELTSTVRDKLAKVDALVDQIRQTWERIYTLRENALQWFSS